MYDKDADYIRRLGEFISTQEKELFQIANYSDKTIFLNSMIENEVDIILTGEDAYSTIIEQNLQGLVICLCEEMITTEETKMLAIFKYQPADLILRRIHLFWNRTIQCQKEIHVISEKKEIISIYSPIHHELQTPFALTVAEELSKNYKVLYLNMTLCSGFKKLCELEEGMDLGDFFYLIKVDQEHFLSKLKSSVYSYGNFFVIPPVNNVEHLFEMTREELSQFLDLLVDSTEYEVLVFDIGTVFLGFYEFLERSSKIWIPQKNDCYMQPAVLEFEALIKKKDPKLLDKLNVIPLRKDQEEVSYGHYHIESLVAGDMGRCVRRLLKGEIGAGD